MSVSQVSREAEAISGSGLELMPAAYMEMKLTWVIIMCVSMEDRQSGGCLAGLN